MNLTSGRPLIMLRSYSAPSLYAVPSHGLLHGEVYVGDHLHLHDSIQHHEKVVEI